MNENKKNKTIKGFFTNTITNIYKEPKSYSHIHTYVASEFVPSYNILLKLISEMSDNPTLEGFKCLKKYNKIQFYQNIKNPKLILVGIQETDFSSMNDIYTIVIQGTILRGGINKTKRYHECLKNIIEFQKKYPTDKYYYLGTGISLAGAVADLFIDLGYLHEAVTFNSLVERSFLNRSDIKNYRIYLDDDILYAGCGQYACNTKVYSIHPNKKIFINPIEEFTYLYRVHTLNYKKSSSFPLLKKILLKEEEENVSNNKGT